MKKRSASIYLKGSNKKYIMKARFGAWARVYV